MSGNRGEMPPLPGEASQEVESQESAESLLPPVPLMPPLPADVPVAGAQPQEPVLPPKAPERAKPLEVYAIREGFYGGERRSPKNVNRDGSPKTFMIPSMKVLGSWMKLVDPVLQKQREIEDKKKGKSPDGFAFLSKAKRKQKESAGE